VHVRVARVGIGDSTECAHGKLGEIECGRRRQRVVAEPEAGGLPDADVATLQAEIDAAWATLVRRSAAGAAVPA